MRLIRFLSDGEVMPDFLALFPDNEIMLALGDVINYIDSVGTTTQLSAIIDRRVERVGSDGYTIQHRTEIEFLISALVIYPAAGDMITRNSETFVVESVLHDDGHYIRLAIK